MKKHFSKILISLVLTIVLTFSFVGCTNFDNTKSNKANINDKNIILNNVENTTQDNDYTLEFFVNELEFSLTKGEILTKLEDKVKIFTEDNPVYASDKTNSDGQHIPHSFKGFLLEDVLSLILYEDDIKISKFTSLEANSLDGYGMILTKNELSNYKVYLAYEYDGKALTADEENNKGGFRIIVPDFVAQSWASHIKTLKFSEIIKNEKTPNSIYFLENMYKNEELKEKLKFELIIEDAKYGGTYSGFDIEKLKEFGYINDFTSAYIEGFDRIPMSSEDFWEIYKANRGLKYISNSAIILNNENYFPYYADKDLKLYGMNVKNFVFANIDKSCFMSLETARIKFDVALPYADRIYSFCDFLETINFEKSDKYQIILQDQSVLEFTKDELDLDNIEIEFCPKSDTKFKFNCPINGEIKTFEIIGIKGI